MAKEPETETETVSEPVVETGTQSDFDMEAATADISSDLFGQGEEENAAATDKEPIEGEAVSGDITEAPPPQEEKPVEENSAEVQAVGAPKTWNKEELATWATLPKETQDALAPILARREEDFLNGITQYKSAADLGIRYSQVVEPYAPILAAENIDPIQLFQSFAANHYLLSRGTPDQKIALAATMLENYNIPLAQLLEYIAEGPAPVDPKYAALEKEINELKGKVTTRETAETDHIRQRLSTEIEQFANDPAHSHFNELANDIQKLFNAGLAANLQEAYDKALWARPDLRQQELDRLTAEKLAAEKAEEAKRREKVRKSTGDHVTALPKQRDGTIPKGSMDDTLNETMATISSRS